MCSGFKAEPTNAGSLNYMPPEVFTIRGCGASPAMDIWAMGCILYAMVTGKLPFKADKVLEVKQRILHDPVTFPKGLELSDECRDLICRMLDKDPETRAGQFEINEHAWKNKRKFTDEEKEKIKEREAQAKTIAFEEALRLAKEREEASANNSKKGTSFSPTYKKTSIPSPDKKNGSFTGFVEKKKTGLLSLQREEKDSTPSGMSGLANKKPSGPGPKPGKI